MRMYGSQGYWGIQYLPLSLRILLCKFKQKIGNHELGNAPAEPYGGNDNRKVEQQTRKKLTVKRLKDSSSFFIPQKAACIPPSFSVQCSALPCLCNTGKKHTPYRYSGLLPPVSSTIYFWASCRNLSDGMPRHYSSKQRQSANHVPGN